MGLNIRVKNPNVVMSIETNPEVLTVLYKHCRGKMSDETFLLKDEAKLFTSDDFYVDNSSGIFKNSNI